MLHAFLNNIICLVVLMCILLFLSPTNGKPNVNVGWNDLFSIILCDNNDWYSTSSPFLSSLRLSFTNTNDSCVWGIFEAWSWCCVSGSVV